MAELRTTLATTPDARVSVLVVDDEPLARAGLRRALAGHPWLHCVGEAGDGEAALGAIESLKPELVLLDIRMPGTSGIALLPRLQHRPLVIFTTAHAEHAVAAFELGALDYVLKPFGPERLASALERARMSLGEPSASGGSNSVERFVEVFGSAPVQRLFIRQGRAIVPLAVARIAWFEAVGDYVALHLADTTAVLGAPCAAAPAAGNPGPASAPLMHLSLNRLAERLDATRFVRVHRTHIVNLEHVRAFRRAEGGALQAEMADGTLLPVNRTMARELRSLAR